MFFEERSFGAVLEAAGRRWHVLWSFCWVEAAEAPELESRPASIHRQFFLCSSFRGDESFIPGFG